MALADLLTTFATLESGPKPRDDELDLFGLTHRGKVRRENQDHFLLGTIHQQVVIHGTSLPGADSLPLRGQRLGTIMLVADGVGGGKAGREASQLAAETVAHYVSTTMSCFHASGRQVEKEFFEVLRAAALEAHAAVRGEAAGRPDVKGMATTLTLALAVWPKMYVLQVGDSRCYYFLDGELRQVTRDQTLAQDLADKGVLPKESLATSPLSHVLASAIGGGEGAAPEVTRLDLRRGCVVFLCSDGLTKHVSDAEIAEHLGAMQSSEQVCRALVDLALERGGSDNITVIVGTTRGNPSTPSA
jgi:protein phosphatase